MKIQQKCFISENFLDVSEGKVLKKTPDPGEARSLFIQANERFSDLRQLSLNEKNASFRFEAAYEAMREAVQSFLSYEGYKSYSHEAIFSFALDRSLLSEAKAVKADRYREIRNDINYRGKKVTEQEAKDVINFVISSSIFFSLFLSYLNRFSTSNFQPKPLYKRIF